LFKILSCVENNSIHLQWCSKLTGTSVFNSGIPNPGIGVFANPESRDWPLLNPGITGLQKFVKNVLF